MASVLQRLADRGIVQDIESAIAREQRRNRPEGADARNLRRDRTNARIEQQIRASNPGLTRYEIGKIRGLIEQARADANRDLREITTRQTAEPAAPQRYTPNIEARVIVTETDAVGNVRTYPMDIGGLATGSYSEIWERVQEASAQTTLGDYVPPSAREYGPGRRGMPAANPGVGGWKATSFDILYTRIQQ